MIVRSQDLRFLTPWLDQDIQRQQQVIAGFSNLICDFTSVALRGVRALGVVLDTDQRCWAFSAG